MLHHCPPQSPRRHHNPNRSPLNTSSRVKDVLECLRSATSMPSSTFPYLHARAAAVITPIFPRHDHDAMNPWNKTKQNKEQSKNKKQSRARNMRILTNTNNSHVTERMTVTGGTGCDVTTCRPRSVHSTRLDHFTPHTRTHAHKNVRNHLRLSWLDCRHAGTRRHTRAHTW
ncbi:hypothetical protein EJ05DRAFT_338957 [Pseudovirgaria hyperparasitica]|uniref:Uncharacterized protein n=1 Tax=Pseudovirgaria hyperparasitica TaxID=470096 RepID=A0A6A6W8P0_9PEZI|nr:uncharacterized protein EJ05DRAFT_338957 [Pseudovirgaria hyperparasitica]KAF2759248.1 hypothetical protein EJ05DRAFT_338957 [Pseudovirgaria hyperparasitica]